MISGGNMTEKVAIPISNGTLSTHFGHTEQYVIYTISEGKVTGTEYAIPPPHEYGSHPRFLREIGSNVVIASGMGHKAIALFNDFGIKAIIGIETLTPDIIIERYIQGRLQSGNNRCDH
jgi:predicted Fe-Mo cluster-binding NifX family protein